MFVQANGQSEIVPESDRAEYMNFGMSFKTLENLVWHFN